MSATYIVMSIEEVKTACSEWLIKENEIFDLNMTNAEEKFNAYRESYILDLTKPVQFGWKFKFPFSFEKNMVSMSRTKALKQLENEVIKFNLKWPILQVTENRQYTNIKMVKQMLNMFEKTKVTGKIFLGSEMFFIFEELKPIKF